MSRFSRINTIWRKELLDTLRDRRTVIAMVLVPMVLYPALILGALQGFEIQTTQLSEETYDVAVESPALALWLKRVIDSDPARRPHAPGLPAEDVVALSQTPNGPEPDIPRPEALPEEGRKEKFNPRQAPPAYRVQVVPDVEQAVRTGQFQVGLIAAGAPIDHDFGSTALTVVMDRTEFRSQYAAAHVQGILARKKAQMLAERLERSHLQMDFINPLQVEEFSVATPEKVGGSILGQILPLILIVMTITGAIYPAIDLTAGERERGTLETLMVAPVSTVDLISGKFVVVALIGMMSAVLNLLSIGGTVYLGGLGDILSRGSDDVQFPMSALPWILVLLIPLAVMFSALLLAVCSFARSFKEAQNYVMPVMMAALIPAVVGALPGTRLEGPIIIMPVANIVVLTRDLLMGNFNPEAIVWVTLSTCIYAGAAVAVAAKLFGQEAVLFADSASIKTIFKRRFFKPRMVPSIAQALLVLAIVYPENFFLQRAISESPALAQNVGYLAALALVFIVLFALVPVIAAIYMRVNLAATFRWRAPSALTLVAALCFGLSTWILALAWLPIMQRLFPMSEQVRQIMEQQLAWLDAVHPAVLVFFMAMVPAVCEELFFRGYVLSGLRGALGRFGAIAVSAAAFAIYHGSVTRIPLTFVLGVLFGLLAVQSRSIWPSILAHMMHNGITILASSKRSFFRGFLGDLGFEIDISKTPPMAWTYGAGVLLLVGLLCCLRARRLRRVRRTSESRVMPEAPQAPGVL